MPQFLQGRSFGLPNLVLIGGAAVVIWLVFRRAKPSQTTAATSKAGMTPTGQATTDYSLGYAQGLQAASPGQASTPSTPRTVTAGSRNPYLSGTTIPSYTQQGSLMVPSGSIPFNTVLNVSGPPRSSQYQASNGGTATTLFIPVNYLGSQLFVSGDDITQPQGGGTGGAGPRKHHVGSRSAHEWHDAHPAIGARVAYPHYVRAVGGPGQHIQNVHRVARQAGVHPARVLMLNPHHTGLIRIA